MTICLPACKLLNDLTIYPYDISDHIHLYGTLPYLWAADNDGERPQKVMRGACHIPGQIWIKSHIPVTTTKCCIPVTTTNVDQKFMKILNVRGKELQILSKA